MADRAFSRTSRRELGAAAGRLGLETGSLAEIAETDRVGAALLSVAPGESKRGVRTQATVLADALEAMIGALYLDAGLAAAT